MSASFASGNTIERLVCARAISSRGFGSALTKSTTVFGTESGLLGKCSFSLIQSALPRRGVFVFTHELRKPSRASEHECLRLGLHRYIVGVYIGFGKEPPISRMTRMFEMTKHEGRMLWESRTPAMVVISTRRSEGPTSESLFAKCSRRVSDRFPHKRARCGCANPRFAAMQSPSVAS